MGIFRAVDTNTRRIPTGMPEPYRWIAAARDADVLDTILDYATDEFSKSLDRIEFDMEEVRKISQMNLEERRKYISYIFRPVVNGNVVSYDICYLQDIEPIDNPLYFVNPNIIDDMKRTINTTAKDIIGTVVNDTVEQPLTTLEDVFINYVGALNYLYINDWLEYECDMIRDLVRQPN